MIEYGIGYVEARGLSTGELSDAQRTLYFIAENMKKQQSISKDGYEHFQQAIEVLGYQNVIDQTVGEGVYTPADIKRITDYDDRLPIIIEVGGVRIPLRHVYTVTQGMVEDNTFPESAIGSLVLDLDI